MTLSLMRAAQIVNTLRIVGPEQQAVDLFTHFVEHFGLVESLTDDPSSWQVTNFADMCGYIQAADIAKFLQK